MVIYSATVERQREYGVLKAIGARNALLYRTVLTQALLVASVGALTGVGLAAGIAQLIMTLRPQFLIVLNLPRSPALYSPAWPWRSWRRWFPFVRSPGSLGEIFPEVRPMLRIALRNLFQNKVRLAIAVGGVALALMLIVALDAVVGGAGGEAHRLHRLLRRGYLRRSVGRAEHAWPPRRFLCRSKVRYAPSLALRSVTPVLYLTNLVVSGENRHLAYVIGVPPSGCRRALAHRRGQKRCRDARRSSIAGSPSSPGSGWATRSKSWARVHGCRPVGRHSQSDQLGRVHRTGRFRSPARGRRHRKLCAGDGRARQSPEVVARQIEALVHDVTAADAPGVRRPGAQGDQRYEHRRDPIMNLIGVLIGIAVMALTVYTATLARRAEYGVLKALGARTRSQRGARTGADQCGDRFVLSLAFTLALAAIVPLMGANLFLQVRAAR